MALLTWEDQVKFLKCVKEHIQEGGRLIFDTRLPSSTSLELSEEDFSFSEKQELSNGISLNVYYKKEYDPMAQELTYHIKKEFLQKSEKEKQTKITKINVKLTFPKELEFLLASNGFEVEEIFSNFDGDPVDPEGRKLVYVCKRSNP